MPEDQKPVAQTVEVSIEQFAHMCGVTNRWIQYIIHQGFIQKKARGKLDLVEAMRGWTAYMEHKVTEATKKAAGTEVNRARAREIEQRVAQRAKDLLPTADALAMVDEVIVTYRQEFDGLPAWITRDPRERRRIEKRLDEIHAAANSRLEKRARNLEASNPSDDAPAKTRTRPVGGEEQGVPRKRGRPWGSVTKSNAIRHSA